MKDFWKETEEKFEIKKLNKKKITILIAAIVGILLIITIITTYTKNKTARNWIDKNILRKQIEQNNLPSIEIEDADNTQIIAFNKYIGILNKNEFTIYNGSGKKENTIGLEIKSPIWDSKNQYLAVAEEKGQKLYLISDKEILWEKSIEGNISQITVNPNGYVAVTIVDTSYKAVVAVFDGEGKQLFKTLSSTRVVSVTISNDNKYLAQAEIDTSGTIVKSSIKIISIEEGKEEGQNKSENSVKQTIEGQNGDLIIKIKYQEKDKLLCMYTNKIVEIKPDETTETIKEYENKKISYASIELNNTIITIEEKQTGIFTADSVVNITNSDTKAETTYTADSVTKEIYTNNNIIALNLGSEVDFINTNGWLKKQYKAGQEITSIVISNNIAGIVYRDKIEIVNL